MSGIELTAIAERESPNPTTFSDSNIVVLDPNVTGSGFGETASAILDPAWLDFVVEESVESVQPPTEFPTLNFRPDAIDRQSFMNLASFVSDEPNRFWFREAIISETRQPIDSADTPQTIWSTDHIQQLLAKPTGSSIDLSLEEAREILRTAFGAIPDLPQDDDFRIDIADALGHAIMDDVRRSDE